MTTAARRRARQCFVAAGGTLRTSAALAAGVHPSTLYAMRDSGEIVPLARGLFRLADLPPPADPDLLVVARRVPKAVVCLVSALSFHEITTQIPSAVDIALPRGHARPRMDHPPLRPHWFSGRAYSTGVEEHHLGEAAVRVTSPEKTLADIFKLRRQIGLEIGLEAVRLYRDRKPVRIHLVLEYARTCRVERVITPYLEAIL